eukprot:12671-Heterococcus_DN1.PRE.1
MLLGPLDGLQRCRRCAGSSGRCRQCVEAQRRALAVEQQLPLCWRTTAGCRPLSSSMRRTCRSPRAAALCIGVSPLQPASCIGGRRVVVALVVSAVTTACCQTTNSSNTLRIELMCTVLICSSFISITVISHVQRITCYYHRNSTTDGYTDTDE